MASIWKQTSNGQFETFNLDDGGAVAGVRFMPLKQGNRSTHVLVVHDREVLVNGSAVVGGIRMLDHKDELIVDAERIFFSAESTPFVEVYNHNNSQRRPRCPICRGPIGDAQEIVRCPGCSRIYHQIPAGDDKPEKLCWTYSPNCRFCEHPTSMSGEPTWRPEEDDE